jgi:hypothetical protein
MGYLYRPRPTTEGNDTFLPPGDLGHDKRERVIRRFNQLQEFVAVRRERDEPGEGVTFAVEDWIAAKWAPGSQSTIAKVD